MPQAVSPARVASASGFAGGGEMGVRAEYWSYPGGNGANVQGSASSTYDITLTAPKDGWASSLISMSVVTGLTADLLVEIQTTVPFSRNSNAFLEARVNVSATGASGRVSTSASSFNPVAVVNPDTIASQRLNNQLVTPTLMIDPTGVITITLTARAGSTTYGDSTGHALVEALNTFHFDDVGPAFLLPAGATVDSAEANIVDNQWVDPTPAPEPTLGLLGLLAAAGLTLRSQRRERLRD